MYHYHLLHTHTDTQTHTHTHMLVLLAKPLIFWGAFPISIETLPLAFWGAVVDVSSSSKSREAHGLKLFQICLEQIYLQGQPLWTLRAETRSLLAMRSPLHTWEKALLWWWTCFLKCVSSVPSGLRQSHPNPRRYRISLSFLIIDHAYHSFLLLWMQGTFKIQHCLLKNYLVHFQNSNWSIWLRDR